MTRLSLKERYVVILCVTALFSVIYHVVLLYPPYGNGLPSGFDGYVHAGVAHSLAENGFVYPQTSIYPPLFLLSLGFLSMLTGIQPIRLISPYGIVVDVLLVFPMYYIASRICDGNKSIGLLAAFFVSIDPVTFNLLCLGSIPNLLGFLWLLLLMSVLLSDLRNKPAGIILMAILSVLIFFTHILVSAFLLFIFGVIFIHEFILKRDNRYMRPLFYSLLIAAVPVFLYYIPRMLYFYLGTTTGGEYIIWVSSGFILLPILSSPLIFLAKRKWMNRYISSRSPYLTFLKFWYVVPILIALIFIWEASIFSRMWQFLSLPAIVVISSVLVRKFAMMEKTRGERPVKAIAAAILTVCVVTTAFSGAYQFNVFFYATPERLALANWISINTPANATFCTEEEFLPTHLGWYVSGLTGRIAYESLSNFSVTFEVGSQTANAIRLARNITSLPVGSASWTTAVKELDVTYVILLANRTHPNYATISDKIVYANAAYVVYNITTFTLS